MDDFRWSANAETNGTSFRAMFTSPWSFEETVGRILRSSGQTIFANSDEYKVSFEAVGLFNGEVFTLYDYKGDFGVHIGGHDELDFKGLHNWLVNLLADTIPSNYSAMIHYNGDRGKRYGWKGEQDGKA